MICAGSFVVVEESSEKTEKTERSEEALHHIQASKAFVNRLIKQKETSQTNRGFFKDNINEPYLTAECNFNITFIYTTSFLDHRI